MESDFRTILTTHAPLTAIVPATSIHRAYYPQSSPDPAIRITKVAGDIGLHMQGSDRLTESVMQIDIRTRAAGGAAQLVSIRSILLALLHPYRGIVGATNFRLISLSNDRGEAFEKPATIEYLTGSLDFDVWSRPAA
jgi:hypothetical protein